MVTEAVTLASWSPGTRATLVNVPWNNDYRDIVKFSSKTELDGYISSLASSTFEITRMTYLKPNEPIVIGLPFSQVYAFNYLRVDNSALPVPGDLSRSYYYFITDVQYIAPESTQVILQLDVWTTFGLDVKFGRCYIEQGHIGIANSNAMSSNGRDFLDIPEGLDTGNEYGIAFADQFDIGAISVGTEASYDIIVATTVSFEGSGGTVDDPTLVSARGSNFAGLPNGCEFYWFPSLDSYSQFARNTRNAPWVTSGIVSIMAVPSLDGNGRTPPQYDSITTSFQSTPIRRLKNTFISSRKVTVPNSNNWRDGILNNLPERYRRLKKFLVYPYTAIEVTTYSGTPIVLQPQNMVGSDITMVEMLHVVLPGPRAMYYPYRYNAIIGGNGQPIAGGDITSALNGGINDRADFLDVATGITDMPTFSVANSSYLTYMASNRNAIAFAHSSADWSQQRALSGNSLGFSQAQESMRGQRDQLDIDLQRQSSTQDVQNTAAIQQAILSGATGIAGGASGGVAGIAAGAAGAVTGGISTGIGINAANQSLAISQSAQRASTGVSQRVSSYMADTNKAYADWAAQGDYSQAIAGINAKVQDAKLVPPTTAGQVGGDAFLLATYQWSVHAKIKRVSGAALASIGEYWLRYGYAINRFIVPPESLQVMDRFTYWRMKETYIVSAMCPEPIKQTIRGIFEKGVTVWKSPDDIGVIDVSDNRPLEGIAL